MEERTSLYAETPFQRSMMEKTLAMARELERAGAAAADGQGRINGGADKRWGG